MPSTTPINTTHPATVISNTSTVAGSNYTSGITTFGYNSGYSITSSSSTTANVSSASRGPIITLCSANKELVRLNNDGSVTWADDIIKIDEAAKSLATSLSLSAEIAAGITAGVKQRMKDMFFEEMITIAEEKGSITAEDLTYYWRAAKIVDKLKGII